MTLQEMVGMIDVVEMSEDGGKQGWDAEQPCPSNSRREGDVDQ